jgi:hypothetical protein
MKTLDGYAVNLQHMLLLPSLLINHFTWTRPFDFSSMKLTPLTLRAAATLSCLCRPAAGNVPMGK